jgi:hypothetical protein
MQQDADNEFRQALVLDLDMQCVKSLTVMVGIFVASLHDPKSRGVGLSVSNNTKSTTIPADICDMNSFGQGKAECFHNMPAVFIMGTKW